MTADEIREILDLCRRILDLAEDAVEQTGSGGPRTVDQYWMLASEEAFEMVDCPQMLVGSLSDDLEELRQSIARPEDERVLWHELQHVACLMNYLSYLHAAQRRASE